MPHEGSLDVLLVLGGSLDIKHVVVAGQLEGLLLRDHPFLHEVAFVANQHQNNVLIAVILDVLDPSGHVPKRFLAGDIKNNQGGGRRAVVGARDGFEFLLARRVPDLQLYHLVVQHDVAARELNSHRVLVARVEAVLHEPPDYARLPHRRVPHQDEFERVVETICQIHLYL